MEPTSHIIKRISLFFIGEARFFSAECRYRPNIALYATVEFSDHGFFGHVSRYLTEVGIYCG